jgi:hypothetical protein
MELSDVLKPDTEDDSVCKQQINNPGDVIRVTAFYEKTKRNPRFNNTEIALILAEHGMKDTHVLCGAIVHDVIFPDKIGCPEIARLWCLDYDRITKKEPFFLDKCFGIIPTSSSIALTTIQSAKILYLARKGKEQNNAFFLNLAKRMIAKNWGKYYGREKRIIRDPVNDAIHKSINKLL